jgi:hypothetical protein
VTDLEQVVDQVFLAVLAELLQRPEVLLRAEVAVVVVEAVGEAGAVTVLLVLGRAVPEVDVGVDDEVVLAVFLVLGGAPPG